MLRPQLTKLDAWLAEWEVDEEDQRKLYCQIADIAEESGEEKQSYQYVLKALRTFDPKETEEISSTEAQNISLRALKTALLSNTHFDYNDFRDEHEGWIEEEGLDNSKLHRKMRLLTLASVAASTNSRELEYKRIAKALQIPAEDVEMWVIDVIRAGLIEGKLSQQKQVFLVHRTTYRVFGEKQWREVATRLDQWKESLRAVKEVISRERQAAEAQKEREMHEVERKVAGASGMGSGRRIGGRDNMVEMGTD